MSNSVFIRARAKQLVARGRWEWGTFFSSLGNDYRSMARVNTTSLVAAAGHDAREMSSSESVVSCNERSRMLEQRVQCLSSLPALVHRSARSVMRQPPNITRLPSRAQHQKSS